MAIKAEALKVLVIESYPRWEYRYLRNALERDPGVELSCLLFHPGLSKRGGGPGYLQEFPPTSEELAKYDVVFLGDVGVQPGSADIGGLPTLARTGRETGQRIGVHARHEWQPVFLARHRS